MKVKIIYKNISSINPNFNLRMGDRIRNTIYINTNLIKIDVIKTKLRVIIPSIFFLKNFKHQL